MTEKKDFLILLFSSQEINIIPLRLSLLLEKLSKENN